DLFYIGPKGSVIHKWWGGGIDTPWASTTKSEDLGGSIAVGTLTASWAPNGKSVNIAGLGQGDAKTPPGCGQYWGMNLAQGGGHSGWGSFEGTYGLMPVASAGVTYTSKDDQRVKLLVGLVGVLAIISFLTIVGL